MVFHLKKLVFPSTKDALCQDCLKLDQYGSGEEDFLISSMYVHYLVIISPWKRAGPSFEQTWIPFTQGCFVPCLDEIGPCSGSGEEWKCEKFTDRRTDRWTDRRRTKGDQKSSLELSAQVSLKSFRYNWGINRYNLFTHN